MTSINFTGVILAGGASRRMGTDKAALRASNGDALLTVIKNRLQEAGAAKIVILGRPHEKGGLADKQPFAGPVRAISDYLDEQTTGSQHLVVPVDMPNLSTPLLRALVRSNTWANFASQHMPFFAVSDSSIPSDIKRIGDLLSYKEALTIPVPQGSEQAFLNLNHPSDFSNWRTNYQLPTDSIPFTQGAQHHV
ncbi:MAG: molybdenum cofactor guanylyltransferase [Kordiimonas sp.]